MALAALVGPLACGAVTLFRRAPSGALPEGANPELSWSGVIDKSSDCFRK